MIQLPSWISEKYKTNESLKKYEYRFLTSRESFLLMGFRESEIANINFSKTNKYKLIHQAGNSIVVDILEKIFEAFLK